MSRLGKSLTIALTNEQSDVLELMALKYGYKWGKFGNISSMMRALADGELLISQVLPSYTDEFEYYFGDDGIPSANTSWYD